MKKVELKRLRSSLFLILLGGKFLFSGGVEIVGVQDGAKKYEDYLVAELELAKGDNLEKAEDAFESVLRERDSDDARHGLIRTWMKSGKLDLIAKEENNFDLEDLEMQLVFLVSYLNTGKSAEADKLLTSLRGRYPKNEQVAYYYALSLINKNKLNPALTYLDNFLRSVDILSSKHSYFYFLKAKVYVHLGKHSQALASADKSLQLYPNFAKGWLFKALLSEQIGNVSESIKAYKAYLNLSGKEEGVIRKLVTLLFNNGRYLEAETELKKLANLSPEYFFDIALIQAKGGRLSDSLRNLNNALSRKSGLVQAKILKSEVLLRSNKVQEAITFVSGWIESDPSNKNALAMLPVLKNSGVKQEVLAKMLHGIVDKGIVHKNLLAILADLYVDTRKLKEALPYLDQIFALTKDELLKSKILYQKGYTYFVSAEGEKAEGFLKKAIATNEVFIPAYNLLAYCYAHAGKNLEVASMLIDKALLFSKDDPVFLDTKGYIALKKGDKKTAKSFFKKALTIAENDKVIIEHLKIASR